MRTLQLIMAFCVASLCVLCCTCARAQTSSNVYAVNATILPGQNGTVSINLAAQGNENCVGFSLNYDPTVLTYVSAVLGSDVPGSALPVVNDLQAANGHIGLGLALQPGEVLAAGTHEIFKVTFAAAANAAATVPSITRSLQFGDTPIAREVVDKQANDLTAQFIDGTITIPHINTAPTIASQSDVTVLENAAASMLTLTGISTGGENWQHLTVTAQSDNTTVVPDPTISYTSPNATGTLTFKPATDQYGAANITVTVKDDGGSAYGGSDTTTMMFTVNVTYVNDKPTILPISAQNILENAGTQTVNLTGIGPGGTGEESWQTVTVSATSNNTALIPNPMVNYTNPDTTGSLTYTPVHNQSGDAIITVTVQDDGGTDNGGIDTAIITFTVHVGFVNTAPTLNVISNVTCNENAGTQTVNLSGISAGDSDDIGQTLTVSAVSENTALIPNPTVTYTSPNATGSLSFKPVADQWGSAKIDVTVKDNGGTANGGVDTFTRSFVVIVNLVNDPPTIDPIANQSVDSDAGLQNVTLTGIGPGGFGEESQQTVNVTATSDTPGLVPNPSVNGSGATRTLSYQPVAGQVGVATITVTVKDDGGTAFGGIDTTTRTFTITVSKHQPDLWIRTASDVSFSGDGTYNGDGTGQSRSQTVMTSETATYYVAVQNDGGATDNITVKSSGDTTGWTVKFYAVDALLNILGPVTLTGSGWSTGTLNPGQVCYLRADVIWAGPTGSQTSCTVALTATSAANAAKLDVVKLTTNLRRGPDLRIHGSVDQGYLGTGVFNLTGLGQTSTINLTGASTTYSVRVYNVDVAADTINLKAPLPASGWKARYLLSPSNTDITSKVTSAGGYTSASIAAQGYITVLVVVNPNSYVKLDGYSIVTLTGTSGSNPGNQDVVKANTVRK